MDYQKLLPFTVALLPFIKSHTGSRSILPIPKGSMVEELVRFRGLKIKEGVTGFSPEVKKIYEDFKSVMPKNLFVALALNPQLVRTSYLRIYGGLTIGDYGISTILLSWYPKSVLKEVLRLRFGKDTFQGIPLDFPIPDFPNVEDMAIEYENAEDQALLTKEVLIM